MEDLATGPPGPLRIKRPGDGRCSLTLRYLRGSPVREGFRASAGCHEIPPCRAASKAARLESRRGAERPSGSLLDQSSTISLLKMARLSITSRSISREKRSGSCAKE